MNLLLLSPYLPHPRAGHGGGEYLFGLVKHLARRHSVTLLSFADHHESTLASDLASLHITTHIIPRRKGKQLSFGGTLALVAVRTWQLLRSLILWQPYYVSKFNDRRMAGLVSSLTAAGSFDIVQIEYAQMGQYVRFVKSGTTFLREHDVVVRPAYRQYRKARSIARKAILFIEYCRWARYEPALVRKFNRVVTFTDPDRDLLSRLARTDNVSTNPICVDVPESIPDYAEREKFSLLFVGAFSHVPNIDAVTWLCAEIFPELQKACPQATLHIIGRNPPLAAANAAAVNPSIHLYGFVESIEEFYRRMSVSIAPVRMGGGIRTKILHAQGHGIPVVATPLGAEGIIGAGPQNILVARTVEGLVGCLRELFTNPHYAASLGEAGRRNVLRYYSWDTVVGQLEVLYKQELGS